tara:strand:+ start:601 stop:951 length:351 start_codon:yes stop_codon:yes gene_type:complete
LFAAALTHLEFVLQHRVDRLARLLQQRHCYRDVVAGFGLIAKQGQDKGAVAMQIGLIRCLLDGLITASNDQLKLIHAEAAEATGDEWRRCVGRRRRLLALAARHQHGNQKHQPQKP